jgi:isopentenyldiphosphate isomerase
MPAHLLCAAFDVRDFAEQTGYRAANASTIQEDFLCFILMAAVADGFVPPDEHMEMRDLAR